MFPSLMRPWKEKGTASLAHFQEMGRFIGTSSQTLIRKLNEESVNGPKLTLYGYQKADLKNAFGKDFTDTADIATSVTDHETTLIPEIELLRSENACLQKALSDL